MDVKLKIICFDLNKKNNVITTNRGIEKYEIKSFDCGMISKR